ncbi:hypothetical protein T484DRAFT_3641779, partial [Baffinella frigidus]
TLNPKPETLHLEPSTLNHGPPTLNPQPSTLTAQPSTLTPHPPPLTPQLFPIRNKRSFLSSCRVISYSLNGQDLSRRPRFQPPTLPFLNKWEFHIPQVARMSEYSP